MSKSIVQTRHRKNMPLRKSPATYKDAVPWKTVAVVSLHMHIHTQRK